MSEIFSAINWGQLTFIEVNVVGIVESEVTTGNHNQFLPKRRAQIGNDVQVLQNFREPETLHVINKPS